MHSTPEIYEFCQMMNEGRLRWGSPAIQAIYDHALER
jgi:hypothetical protein